ncbi:MAG TPA: hypothetical protein VNO79_16650 [Actinomycetota bacterium]|nr:hypothetical protein [Actinomycetota bacterium]
MAPVFAAGFAVGQAREQASGRVEGRGTGDRVQAGDPQSDILNLWGGSLLWGEVDGPAAISTVGTTIDLPAQGGVLSPRGALGPTYTYVRSHRALWFPDGRTVMVRLPVGGPV